MGAMNLSVKKELFLKDQITTMKTIFENFFLNQLTQFLKKCFSAGCRAFVRIENN